MSEPLRKVTPAERVEGTYTAGMTREQAFASESMWSGFVRTGPGTVSGWHHHGDHETTIYVVAGQIELDFGPGGEELLRGEPGDFIYVPRATIHRERNPCDTEGHLVVIRYGTGEPVFNVEGPET